MANPIQTQSFVFPNQHTAIAVYPSPADSIESIAGALSLPAYNAVLLVIGGAGGLEPALQPRLTQLMGRGVAKAAAEVSAIILDGGTKSGVMELLGQGVAGNGYRSPLIGVAPAGRVRSANLSSPPDPAEAVSLDPNHSHFVLVEGDEWGNETSMLFGLASALGRHCKTEPTVADKASTLVILVGGGDIARNEVLQAVRQQLPVIVVKGSGGLADQIAAACERGDSLAEDAVLAEIIEDGRLQWHQLTDPVKGMIRLIVRELGDDKVLMQAWETFADYDKNAAIQQKRSDALQVSIILLGVIGTFLAIIKGIVHEHRVVRESMISMADSTARVRDSMSHIVDSIRSMKDTTRLGEIMRPVASPGGNISFGEKLLDVCLIVTPILLTLLITASNRFKQANKWLLLRSGAEAIKREIYHYRTGAKDYQKLPQQVLAQKVEDITRRAMMTEVNTASLQPYDKKLGFPPNMYAARQGGDDGFSHLTPERYVEVRLGDQLNYFRKSTLRLERQLRVLSWAIFIIGGVGTLLSAVSLQVWIAFTTILATALTTYLGYRQTESTLKKYNQTYTDLSNIKSWWNALSSEQQSDQDNIDLLVQHTETVLKSELDGWVQQMQNALVDLRKGQNGDKGDKGDDEDPAPAAAQPVVNNS